MKFKIYFEIHKYFFERNQVFLKYLPLLVSKIEYLYSERISFEGKKTFEKEFPSFET